MRIVAGGKTDRGRKRRRNEDRILISPGSPNGGPMLLAVADGMGGQVAGDAASSRAIHVIESVVREHAGLAPGELLTIAVAGANRGVREISMNVKTKGAGSTLVAALVEGSRVWLANVGDSRAYLIRRDSWRQVTTDHSWAEEEVRAGVISREEAPISRHRNVLTRNLGAGAEIAVDLFGPIDLEDRDSLVLCSDGLHGVVSGDDIAAVVRAYAPEEAANRLVEKAKADGSLDDVSVVVVSAAVED